MNRANKGRSALYNNAAKFSADRESVIAEALAKTAVEELRDLPFIGLARTGAYMVARVRSENVMCALAINKKGGYITDRLIGIGERWNFRAITELLLKFADESGATYMILGISRPMQWEIVLPFNSVYEELLRQNVKILDLIQVQNGEFVSLIKPLARESGDYYDEFK